MSTKRFASTVAVMIILLSPLLLLASGIVLTNQAKQEERAAVAEGKGLTTEVRAATNKERIAAMILTPLVFALPASVTVFREITTKNRLTCAASRFRAGRNRPVRNTAGIVTTRSV
jgi:hypothetical protein